MSKNFITGRNTFSTEAEAVRDVYENEMYRFIGDGIRQNVCVKYVDGSKTLFCMQFWTADEIKEKTLTVDKMLLTYCEPPSNLCYDGDYIIGDRKQTGNVGSAAAWGIEVGTIDGKFKTTSMVYAEKEEYIMEYIQDSFKKGDRKVSKAVFEIL